MPATRVDQALDALRSQVGSDSVITEPGRLLAYSISLDPAGDVFPSAVALPRGTAEVKEIVDIANRYRIPLHPISRGLQHGLGMATAVSPGMITVDLSRMDRIRDYDDKLGYVVIEPGVTFAQLYSFLRDREAPYWMSPTSGPTGGSVIGNALDKGAGYTPYGNHFSNLVGLEVITGGGQHITTGDGALANAKTRYTHKGGYGPILSGLFAQSNLGIVVSAGVWLMPKPPGSLGFVLTFPEHDDIERVVELAGQLRLTGQIPSTISIANDTFCSALESGRSANRDHREQAASDATDRGPLAGVRFGSWNLAACVYGPPGELRRRVDDIRDAFAATGPTTLVTEEEARTTSAFRYRMDIAQGIPNEDELDIYGAKENGSSLYFLPTIPFRGRSALDAVRLSSKVCEKYGFAYTTQFLCSPRSVRNTQPIIFDSSDDDERKRLLSCFEELITVFEQAGYLVSRPPTHFQEFIGSKLGTSSDLVDGVKAVFDPKGIISPGRFGIHVPASATARQPHREEHVPWD